MSDEVTPALTITRRWTTIEKLDLPDVPQEEIDTLVREFASQVARQVAATVNAAPLPVSPAGLGTMPVWSDPKEGLRVTMAWYIPPKSPAWLYQSIA